MSLILVLDDNEIVTRKPADYFVDSHDYTQDEIWQTRNPDALIEELMGRQIFGDRIIDEVWLDHDLGLTGKSGMDVVKYFHNLWGETCQTVLQVGLFRITTNNPAVDRRMTQDLQKCGYEALNTAMVHLGDKGVMRGDYFISDEIICVQSLLEHRMMWYKSTVDME